MAHHRLTSTPDTVHWGWFDAALAPVLTIDSGDTVTIETVSGGPENLPPEGYHIPPELLDIHANVNRKQRGHLLTGPVAVNGAKPGDVLEIRIKDIRLRQDWGYTFIRPLSGALPTEFDRMTQVITRLDRDAGLGHPPWGGKLPLAPFFGVMGVAPPAGWGEIPTIQPRVFGGNLDNKELLPGATLYLPVQADGALFSCGDGHGCQGDGEVCVTAIETALEGTFEFHLRRDLPFDYPHGESPDALMTMGFHSDLDTAARDALRRMVDWVERVTRLSREEAFMLLSLAGDMRITQLVNEEKGSHMVLTKALLAELTDAPVLDWAAGARP